MREQLIFSVLSDDGGSPLTEYAFLTGLIAIAAVGVLTAIGVNVQTFYDAVAAAFN